MPTETNLPTKCELWLELGFRIIEQASNYDSNSKEFEVLLAHGRNCLECAASEVQEWKEE